MVSEEPEDESIGIGAARTLSSLLPSKLVGLVISALTVIVIARLLSPTDYGVYTLAFGFALLIGSMGHFGIGTYFNKHFAEEIHKKNREEHRISSILSTGYSMLILLGAIVSIAGVLLSGYAAAIFAHSQSAYGAFVIASISLFFSMTYGASYSALVGLGRGKYAASSMLSTYSVQFVVSLLLILYGFGVEGAIGGMLAGYFFGFFISIFLVIKAASAYEKISFIIPGREKIRAMLSFSLPIGLTNLLNNGISNFAIEFLGIFTTAAIVGSYGVANKGLSIMAVVYGTIGTVLLPSFSASIAKSSERQNMDRVFNKALIYSLLISVPFVFYVGVFSKPIVYFFLTKKYTIAPQYLLLVSIGVSMYLLGSYASNFLIAGGKVKKVLKYTAVSVAAQLVSLVVLVPAFHAIGAILSLFFIGSIASDLLLLGGMYSIYSIKPHYAKVAKIYASNILLFAVLSPLLLLPHYYLQLLIGAVLVLVLYPPLEVLFGVLDEKSIEEMSSMSNKIPGIKKLADYIYAYANIFIAAKRNKQINNG